MCVSWIIILSEYILYYFPYVFIYQIRWGIQQYDTYIQSLTKTIQFNFL